MNKHGVLAKSAKGAEKDKHRMAALDHQMALRNPDNSQRRSNALSLSNKLGVTEEVELDEAINHLQMAKHHQALAKEHDRISDAANRRDEPELSDAHGHQSDDHQDAAKAHLQAHKTGNPKDVAAAKKATRRSLQTGSTPGGSIYHVGKYGDYSHKDYNYSNLRSGADAIKKGLKEEVEIKEGITSDTGWKPAPDKRKDQYGNLIKPQNVPKRLAKQGMKGESEDRPGIHKVSVTINDKDKDDRDTKIEKMLKVKANNPPAALKIAKSHYGNKGYKVHTASYHGIHEEGKLSSGAKDPCWKGYEMVGTKKKNGREVPNCVPKK